MTTPVVPSRVTAGLLAVSIVATGIVIFVVNFLIYRARALYSQYNPQDVLERPPTISRAISDPSIGDPFASWMQICAPLLSIGVAVMILGAWIELQKGGGAGTKREQRLIAALSVGIALLQCLAAIGIVMLSRFRFPDHGPTHMLGSYLFFFSQAFVIVAGEFLSRRFARQPCDRTFITVSSVRLRRIYVWFPIILGICYLSLFALKEFDTGAFSKWLYIGYTTTEPMLITAFLGYILTYHIDLWSALIRYFRA